MSFGIFNPDWIVKFIAEEEMTDVEADRPGRSSDPAPIEGRHALTGWTEELKDSDLIVMDMTAGEEIVEAEVDYDYGRISQLVPFTFGILCATAFWFIIALIAGKIS